MKNMYSDWYIRASSDVSFWFGFDSLGWLPTLVLSIWGWNHDPQLLILCREASRISSIYSWSSASSVSKRKTGRNSRPLGRVVTSSLKTLGSKSTPRFATHFLLVNAIYTKLTNHWLWKNVILEIAQDLIWFCLVFFFWFDPLKECENFPLYKTQPFLWMIAQTLDLKAHLRIRGLPEAALAAEWFIQVVCFEAFKFLRCGYKNTIWWSIFEYIWIKMTPFCFWYFLHNIH